MQRAAPARVRVCKVVVTLLVELEIVEAYERTLVEIVEKGRASPVCEWVDGS